MTDATMRTPALGPPTCPACSGSLAVRWQTFSNGTRHIRATCLDCGGIRFLLQSQTNRALADAAGTVPTEGPGDLFADPELTRGNARASADTAS
jgi:hypothetical protein